MTSIWNEKEREREREREKEEYNDDDDASNDIKTQRTNEHEREALFNLSQKQQKMRFHSPFFISKNISCSLGLCLFKAK